MPNQGLPIPRQCRMTSQGSVAVTYPILSGGEVAMRPTRVVFVLPTFRTPPATGGERRHHQLIEGLRARGIEVELFLHEELRTSDYRAYRQTALHELSTFGADTLIVIDTWLFRWLWPVVWRLRLRSKARIATMGLANYCQESNGFFEYCNLRAKVLMTLLPAHQCLWVSNASLRRDMGPVARIKRSHLMGTGITMQVPAELFPRDTLGPLRIVSVGSYTATKGFDILVEALALARQRDPLARDGLRLALIGPRDHAPDFTARVDQLVAENGLAGAVETHGQLMPDDLAREYMRSDIFALASASEGFGTASIEAMLHGLPNLLAPYPVANEMIGTGSGAGWTTSGWRAEDFAEHFLRILHAAPADRDSWRMAAHKRGTELRCTWDDVVDHLLDAISH